MSRLFSGCGKDRIGGCLMMALGLTAALQGSTYSIGRLQRMGPGFFPVVLGVLLLLVGAAIALTATAGSQCPAHGLRPEWRGWGCIALSILAFAVLGRFGGLLPATIAIVIISALGDQRNSIVDALMLAAGISIVSVVVFSWGLQVQFPLFSWD